MKEQANEIWKEIFVIHEIFKKHTRIATFCDFIFSQLSVL